VFDREAARSIVGYVAGCILGDTIYRQRSYLADRLGTCIGSKHVTLVDDPLLLRGPGSIPFDGEGRKVRRNVVARGGTLHSFLLDSYSARKLKMKPTGSAGGGGGIPHSTASNFFLARGRSKPESLLRGVRKGLYVTRMMGFGFDPTTGDLSKGAEGFLIERGELTDPVGEVTVALNLDDLLKGIDRVANDLEHRTSVSSPSFRVATMKIGGV
jgi:PmbA protein